MEIQLLIETYGLPGMIIAGLVWAYREERKERKDAQKNENDTLRLVMPVISALQATIASLEAAERRVGRDDK